MIVGAHSILYSANAAADRAFLRDVLGFPSVDVGDGWLIFGLPPSEVAVHPSEKNDVHELYLMTDDVAGLVADLTQQKIKCSAIENRGWGLLTQVTLPGGGKLGIYQPRHARPKAMAVRAKTKAKTKTTRKTKKAPARRATRPAARKGTR